MNTPIYDQIVGLYATTPTRTLQADVLYYLRAGYVFSTPRLFLMGEHVGDGWFIHVAVGVGALKDFCDLMPFYLPWIGWAREADGKHAVMWHKTDKLVRRLGYDAQEFKNRKLSKVPLWWWRGESPAAASSTVTQGCGDQCGQVGRRSEQETRVPIYFTWGNEPTTG